MGLTHLLFLTITYTAWQCSMIYNSSSIHCFQPTFFRFLPPYDFRHHSWIPPSLVQFCSLKTLPCIFLVVSLQLCFYRFYLQFVTLLSLQFFKFCSSPVFFRRQQVFFSSFCLYSFLLSVSFSCKLYPLFFLSLSFHLYLSLHRRSTLLPTFHLIQFFFLIFPVFLSTHLSFGFQPFFSFFYYPVFLFLSLSPLTFSPSSHLFSYPVFLFLSLSPLTFSPSSHLFSYPVFLFLSLSPLTFSPSSHLFSYPVFLFLSLSPLTFSPSSHLFSYSVFLFLSLL